MASARVYPKIDSAPVFQCKTAPSAVVMMAASVIRRPAGPRDQWP